MSLLACIAIGLFAVLKKPGASAAELRNALSSIDQAAAECVVDQLEAERRSLLLQEGTTEKKLDDIEAKIVAANRDVERLHAAQVELERLVKVAEEREKQANIEERVAECRAIAARLIDSYVAFDEAASRVAKARAAIELDHKRLEQVNAFLADHDRGDDRQETPGQILRKLGIFEGDLPRISEWVMPSYYPISGRPGRFSHARKLLDK